MVGMQQRPGLQPGADCRTFGLEDLPWNDLALEPR